jgi:hypothetical protein
MLPTPMEEALSRKTPFSERLTAVKVLGRLTLFPSVSDSRSDKRMITKDLLGELRPKSFEDLLPIAVSSQTATRCTANAMFRVELPIETSGQLVLSRGRTHAEG